ncbi:methylated-DNA--[protein]-cysteine S-methyltransferase [Streptomyces sp. NPDC001414]
MNAIHAADGHSPEDVARPDAATRPEESARPEEAARAVRDDEDMTTLLSTHVDAETLGRLHRRLERAAERADLVDVAYTTVDSPVGKLLLAATPQGLVRVAYAREDHDRVLETLGQKLSPRILRVPGRLDEAAREIDEYFAGHRQAFDLTLDLSLSRGFRRLVQTRLPEIGYGQTRSYRDMAELVGNPKAVRAVGTACATNPLPIVVPCHRVLRTDGTPGGYVGGLEAKTALLNLEATA